MLKYLPIFFTLVVLASCNSTPTQQETFWDSKSYFQSEITRLTNEHIGLDKTLLFDTKDQTTKQATPNWEKELEPFCKIDLQKVSYKRRFTIDTLTLGDTAYKIEYTAIEPQTDLQYCSIICANSAGRMISFSATFKHLNNLYRSTKTYVYTPRQGYSITGDQQVKLVTPVDYEITGHFMYP